MTAPAATARLLSLIGALALLGGCGGGKDADNLAELDARLTNGVQADAAADAAVALAAAGGRIEKAPAPRAVESSGDVMPRTGVARGQAASGECGKAVKLGPQWAERMPEPFRVYPGGRLTEAGGVEGGACTLRIVSFSTDTAIDPLIDYYYTQARRAGYDAEHLLDRGEHQLGGTHAKDGAAYVVFARRTAENRTEVEIVAN